MSLQRELDRAKLRLASQKKELEGTAVALDEARKRGLDKTAIVLQAKLTRQQVAVELSSGVVNELQTALGAPSQMDVEDVTKNGKSSRK